MTIPNLWGKNMSWENGPDCCHTKAMEFKAANHPLLKIQVGSSRAHMTCKQIVWQINKK